MTISNSGTRVQYAGNGSTRAFAVTFQFFTADEIQVYAITGGEPTLLTRGTHYSVTGGLGSTGTVTAVDAPPVGTSWNIRRTTNRTQLVNWTNNDPFDGDTTETALDRLVALAQEADEANARSVRAAPGEAPLSALPLAASRANKALLFDANGNPTAGDLSPNTVPISTAMQPVVAAASLASARSAMGIPLGTQAVNVKDTPYGAVGNGAADDSAAVAAAMASAPSGLLYFPPGIYKFSNGVNWKKGWTIRGAGPQVTTIAAGANGLSLLSHTATAPAEAFDIGDIRFDYNGFASITHINVDGVDATKRCSYIVMRNIYFNGGVRAARMYWCQNAELTNLYASNVTIGIENVYCADIFIQGGRITGGGDAGIFIASAAGYGHTRIQGVTTDGQSYGLNVSTGDFAAVTGCSFLNAAAGPIKLVNARGFRITGCELATGGTPASPGLAADSACERLMIVGNEFYLCTEGMTVGGERHTINGNVLHQNSGNDITLSAKNCAVVGNMCESTGSANSIVETGGADHNAIAGNATNGSVVTIGAGSSTSGSNTVF